jgi:hypothetical protein
MQLEFIFVVGLLAAMAMLITYGCGLALAKQRRIAAPQTGPGPARATVSHVSVTRPTHHHARHS